MAAALVKQNVDVSKGRWIRCGDSTFQCDFFLDKPADLSLG